MRCLGFIPIVLLLCTPLTATQAAVEDTRESWIEKTLVTMTLEEKVGQLIVAGTGTFYQNAEATDFETIKRNIRRYHVGGYHAFRGDVYSAAFLIRRMQKQGRIPLLITADLEGGTGLIFQGATRFPKAMALGALGDVEAVRRVGEITATEAKALGIHVNFSPVVDVNNNPDNPIINIRSFGEDPQAVGRLATAYIEGVQSQGLLATAKHFPGHGDTSTDSHLELPVIDVTRDRLEHIELPPFRQAVLGGVAAVMTAHLSVPALEPNLTLPATLSPNILDGLLRHEMGFEGLIFTDAMNMKGVADQFRGGEAAVRAILAGADMILYPTSIPKTFRGLLAAVRSGRISTRRLEESVRRILSAKARLGFEHFQTPDVDRIEEVVGRTEYQEEAQRIMDAAVTVVRDERKILPLRLARTSSLLVLTLRDRRSGRDSRGTALVKAIRSAHRKVLHFDIGPDSTANEVNLALALAGQVGGVFAAAYIRPSPEGDIRISDRQLDLLTRLGESKRPFALAVFGHPYLLKDIPETPSYILAFDDYPGAERAVAHALFGLSRPQGKLPVRLR